MRSIQTSDQALELLRPVRKRVQCREQKIPGTDIVLNIRDLHDRKILHHPVQSRVARDHRVIRKVRKSEQISHTKHFIILPFCRYARAARKTGWVQYTISRLLRATANS